MRRFVSHAPSVVVMGALVAGLVGFPALVRVTGEARTRARVMLARQAIEQDDILERISAATRAVADAVRPSVVHIDVNGARDGQFRASAGAGWVWDDAGHVITNAHVVDGARTVRVQLESGRVVTGEVLGTDVFTDIAVLRLERAAGAVPARRATGVIPGQGERVYTFGSPFGFKFSMSEGIISGLGRDPSQFGNFGGYTNFIQTDAAINPGNSGGPLINARGEVIGMCVAIANAASTGGDVATEGQNAGIGFAIPLATIETTVRQLIDGRPIARGFLGITYSASQIGDRGLVEVESEDGSFYARGILVTAVTEGTPAERAGLMVSDVIFEVAGHLIRDADDMGVFSSTVATAVPGEPIDLRVWRDGGIVNLKVALTEFPPPLLVEQRLRNFGIADLQDAQGGGAVILVQFSRAFRDGFRNGQVILQVEGVDVPDAEACLNALAEAGVHLGHSARLLVRAADSDETREVVLSVGRPE
ncbi:MAG: trypsin-like peptidase domain-containing protein [Phycisphaerales bacterium]|jgi:S1-C subfamily serine protease|nr:trypsin-like peptidase domain-containing protein [Phycisphaerales bacterium]